MPRRSRVWWLPFSVACAAWLALLSSMGRADPRPATGGATGRPVRALSNPVDLGLMPGMLDFGSESLGLTSAPSTVTILSTGTQALVISAIHVTGDFAIGAVNLPLTINAGSSATLSVTYSPTMVGAESGTIGVVSNAPESPANVTLQGTCIDPSLTLAPAAFDFGPQLVGTVSAPVTITLGNGGQSPLVVTAATTTGPFSAIGLVLPMTVAVGGSARFTATFAPLAPGTVTAGVSFTSNDARSPIVLALTGSGTTTGLAAYPNPLSFGAKTIGVGGGGGTTLHLQNNTAQAVTIQGASIAGVNPGDFAGPLPPPGTVVPALGEYDVSLTFSPGGHGARSALLTINSNAVNSPQVVTLAGTGQGPKVQLAMMAIDLGALNLGQEAVGLVGVKNVGETALNLTSASLSGPAAADFSSVSVFPVQLDPGGATSLAVKFIPTAIGLRSAQLTLVTNDTLTGPVTVAVTGTGAAPTLALTPPTLAFGDVGLGGASAAESVTIANHGAGPLAVTQVALGGADPMSFALVAPALPFVVPPGGTRTLAPVCVPQAAGALTGTLTFTTDDPLARTAMVAMTCDGVSPAVSLAPMTLDFGASLVGGASAPQVVTLTNTGAAPLLIGTIGFSGAGAGSYYLATPPTLPLTLMPAAMQALPVVFSPAAVGASQASLDVGSDDPAGAKASVPLMGMGVSTYIAVTPASLDFGALREPGQSAPMTLTITNTGTAAWSLLDAQIGGDGATAYAVTSAVGQLLPGATRSVDVRFEPTMPGEANATITFASTDMSIPPAVVNVMGRGAPAKISLTPGAVDFGDVADGTISAPRTITVANISSSSVQLAQVLVAGPFAVTGEDTTSMIPPAGTATFSVEFAPQAAGAATGSVTITLAGATMPEVTLSLTGNGTAAPAPDASTTPAGATPKSGCALAPASRARPGAGAAWLLSLLAFVVAARVRRR